VPAKVVGTGFWWAKTIFTIGSLIMNNQLNKVSPIQKGKNMNTNSELNQLSPERNWKKMKTNNKLNQTIPNENEIASNSSGDLLPEQKQEKRLPNKISRGSIGWNDVVKALSNEFSTLNRNTSNDWKHDFKRLSEFRYHAQVICGAVQQLHNGGDRHSIGKIIKLAQRRLLHLRAEIGRYVDEDKLDSYLGQELREAITEMLKMPGYCEDDAYSLINFACSSGEAKELLMND
jgi:hypothetical protein